MKFSIFLIINSFFLIFHDGELPVNKSNEEGCKKHHRDISYCEKLFINSSKKIRKISFIPEARCSASTDYLNYISDRSAVVSFLKKWNSDLREKVSIYCVEQGHLALANSISSGLQPVSFISKKGTRNFALGFSHEGFNYDIILHAGSFEPSALEFWQ